MAGAGLASRVCGCASSLQVLWRGAAQGPGGFPTRRTRVLRRALKISCTRAACAAWASVSVRMAGCSRSPSPSARIRRIAVLNNVPVVIGPAVGPACFAGVKPGAEPCQNPSLSPFSFAHSCCFLSAISGVNFYAMSAFDPNPRFRSQNQFRPHISVLFLHLCCCIDFLSILRLASISSNIIWISDSSIGCCCVCARAVFGRAVMQASQWNTLPVWCQ